MSVPHENSPRPTPEALMPPEVIPERLFAEHVESVRRQGDALAMATVADTRWERTMGLASGAAALLYNAEHSGSYVAMLGVASLATWGAAAQYVRTDKKAQREAEKRLNPAAQSANKVRYELYRTKDKRQDGSPNITLRWYGPEDPDNEATSDELLQHVVTLAQEHDIATLLVSDGLLGPGDSSKIPSDPTSMTAWLLQKRDIGLRGHPDKDMVVEGTPAQWLEYLAAKEPPVELVPVTIKPSNTSARALKHSPWLRQTTGLGESRFTQPHLELTHDGDPEGIPALARRPIREPMAPKSVFDSRMTQVEATLHQYPVGTEKKDMTQRRLLSRWVPRIGAVILGAGIGFSTTAVGDAWLHRKEAGAAAEIAKEYGIDPAKAHIDPEAARSRAASKSASVRVWGGWYDTRDGFYTWADGLIHKHESESDKATSGISGNIGNIQNPEDDTKSPDWTLSISGQIKPSDLQGHWALATAHTLFGSKYSPSEAPYVFWDTQELARAETTWHSLPTQPTTAHGTSWIKATGFLRSFYNQLGSSDMYMNIPVLEGYTVSAVNVEGSPVTLIHKKDNTYALRLPADLVKTLGMNGPSGEITYWITPTGEAGPKATEPVSFKSLDQKFGFDRQKADKIYDEHITDLKHGYSKTGWLQPAEFVEYMHREFTYAYSPWPDKALRKADDLDDLIETTFEEKKANCNVAMNTMVWAYPELNPVFEYNNQDATPLHLSTSEAHARVVSKNPKVSYDPTPTAALTSPNGPEQPAKIPVLPITMILGLAAIAGLGTRYRQPIKRHTGKAGAQAAIFLAGQAAKQVTSGVEWADATVLRETLAMANHAAWSHESKPIGNDQLRRDGANTTQTPQETFAALKDPVYRDRTVLDRLRQDGSFSLRHRTALRIAGYAAYSQRKR